MNGRKHRQRQASRAVTFEEDVADSIVRHAVDAVRTDDAYEIKRCRSDASRFLERRDRHDVTFNRVFNAYNACSALVEAKRYALEGEVALEAEYRSLAESWLQHVRLDEDMELSAGNVRRMDNDSADLALDAFFRKASTSFDVSSAANSTAAELDDGSDGKRKFSFSGFASDIARLTDRADVVLGLKGILARRAYNYVVDNYGQDAAADFLDVLENVYNIDASPSSDEEGERNANNPPAVGAGGSGGSVG